LFQRLGLTRKKLSLMGLERDRAAHAEFMMRIAGINPEDLVFLDETRVDHRSYNRYGAEAVFSVRGQIVF
jgi:hypothetical protein